MPGQGAHKSRAVFKAPNVTVQPLSAAVPIIILLYDEDFVTFAYVKMRIGRTDTALPLCHLTPYP